LDGKGLIELHEPNFLKFQTGSLKCFVCRRERSNPHDARWYTGGADATMRGQVAKGERCLGFGQRVRSALLTL
jgi:hypothetical protein